MIAHTSCNSWAVIDLSLTVAGPFACRVTSHSKLSLADDRGDTFARIAVRRIGIVSEMKECPQCLQASLRGTMPGMAWYES